jgi:hypothetical protein
VADYEIVQGDSAPALVADLAFDDGTLADLSGASVQMFVRNPGLTSLYLNKAMTVTLPNVATYIFTPSDTGTPGDYFVQFEVTYADTTQQTFPTAGYKTLRIAPALDSAYTPSPGGYLASDAIRDVRVRLGSRADNLNKVLNDVAVTDQFVVLQYPANGVGRGVRLGIGLEDMYAWDSASGDKNVPVQRGHNATPTLDHAAGELVRVNPQFTDADILRALNAELGALPGKGLFAVKTADFIADQIKHGYPLPAGMIEQELLGLTWLPKTNLLYRPQLGNYRVELNAPVDEFPTGNALFLYELPMPGQPFRVTYKAAFAALAMSTDVVGDVTGLWPSATDLLVLGAALRLLDSQPPRRADQTAQGDVRRADEARVNEVFAATQGLRIEYRERLSDEVSRLNGQYAPTLARRSPWR